MNFLTFLGLVRLLSPGGNVSVQSKYSGSRLEGTENAGCLKIDLVTRRDEVRGRINQVRERPL